MSNRTSDKPFVLITGSGGFIGGALVNDLSDHYHLIGLDRSAEQSNDNYTSLACDLTDESAIERTLKKAGELTTRFAAVIHLAAYFDFSGDEHPLYQKLNVDGTRLLIRQLKEFTVERFIYASTILVHKTAEPGLPIDESSPTQPKWAYPKSKLAAEKVIEQECGEMPYAILRLAGLYTADCQSPTLAHQIDRIYQDKVTGHVYAGNPHVGQSALHIDDMLSAMRATVERRQKLPSAFVALIGEPVVTSYSALQNAIGEELHHHPVHTIPLPKPLAKVGAWAQEKAEPLIPDSIDQGEKPFIRPYMIDLSEDHYELDISRARKYLDWQPQHFLRDELPTLMARFKEDPERWYAINKIAEPLWLKRVAEVMQDRRTSIQAKLEELENRLDSEHRQWLWTYALGAALGIWMMASPATLGYWASPMAYSDLVSGLLIFVFSLLSLSRTMFWARWLSAATGLWLAFAPLVFWTESPAAYLNGSLVGLFVAGLSVLAKPTPGIDVPARQQPRALPPGWSYAPSTWTQRLPIVLLAFVGFLISRYLAAYQLGHAPTAWDPFFGDGTERIITSSVSEAWPVPDAGLGALVYLMEIIAGTLGSRYRWHQMPWLTLFLGFLIVPLGVVSIYFIIIQPIIIGTWCTLCLITATAMLFQIPFVVDEVLATAQFLFRQRRHDRPLLRVLLMGDVVDSGDHGQAAQEQAGAEDSALFSIKGISLPWTLCLSAAIGVGLMCSRVLAGSEPPLAHADHLIGALVVTVSIISLAQSARPLRFINGVLGLGLIAAPLLFSGGGTVPAAADIVLGIALIVLCIPRGRIDCRYGSWDRYLV